MTDFASRAARATREDRRLLAASHRVGFRLLRAFTRLGPVVRVPGIGVIVSEAGIIRQVLLDSEHFSKVGRGASSTLWSPVIGDRGLINMDGPEHAHLRRQLGPMFTPRFLKVLLGDIVDPQLQGIQKRLLAGEDVDLGHEIELTMANVLCRLAGWNISGNDEHRVLEQLERAREMLGLVKITTKSLKPAQVAVAKTKLAGIEDSIRAAFRAAESGTVPTLLREVGLSEDDTVSVVLALILAGTETTISHLPRVTRLALESGYLNRLTGLAGSDADEVAGAERALDALLQEGFRVTVPSPVMMRSVVAPALIDGMQVRPGDRVVIATYEACQRLGDFNPDRPIPPEMRQLWFGAGVHFCIGMPLAMRVVESYLRMLAMVEAEHPLRVRGQVRRRKSLAAGFKHFVVVGS
ncbi:MAG: cytochrome P450 [Micrococcales bacterium]